MKRVINYFQLEKEKSGVLMAALFVATVSGFSTYFFNTHNTWQQWTFLLHSLSGIYLAIVITPYIYYHYRRTIGLRRPLVYISGLATMLLFTVLLVSGLYISLFGQQESLRWIYDSHVVTSFIAVLLLTSHLLFHKIFLPEKRKKTQDEPFPSMTQSSLRFSVKVTSGIIGALLVLTLLYELSPSSYVDEAVHQPYELTYGDHPFRPSQTEIEAGEFLDVKRISGSDKCGACHGEITKQWQSSMHSQAASDKSYQTNANLLSKKVGMAATRYCEGCHAPVALLSGELTKGGRLNTPGHMKEGVSCKTCHGISQIEHLKGVASYRLSFVNDYLFPNSGLLGTKIHNYLIKIQPRQHRKDMNRSILSTPELCATCHAQFMDKDINNWGYVKMQDEYTAWLNSPYSKQSEQDFSHGELKRCQDCHMPLMSIKDPSSNKNGMASSHLSLGANTAIPWFNGDKKQLALTTEFLQSNKIRVSIEKPSRDDATHSKKIIDPSIFITDESPAYFYLGESVNLDIIVSNVGVGHDFPGGTTDINEAWIEFKVVDAQNNEVFISGALTDNNDVDPGAYFYRSLAVDRHGKHVWKHDLFNMVGDSFKKIIPSGEADIVTYNFDIPSWVKSPLSISATVKYRKFNNRYARWVLQDDTIKLPIVDVARTSLLIPVRIKPEVTE